ncbi:ABC transporter permease subunit [Elioraea rosea]|uniref:ABC transporter permease subunit n=1 Tax=Elioraea rosea TaxID=2492390 RepID=UPI0011841A59|nr:ABC transporter permease subunit [Elioraea rosea]
MSTTVLLPAAVAFAGMLLPLPWLVVAPNRLLPGTSISALATLGALLPVVALLTLAALPRRVPAPAAACSALAAAVLLAGLTGQAAAQALQGLAAAARAGVGFGFWAALVGSLGLCAARGASLGALGRLLLLLTVAASFALLLASGALHSLSLLVEYRVRAEAVQAAILQHLVLSGAALMAALLLAVPLAWAAFRQPRLAAPIGAVFATVQVVPALALFALLIPLLAALLASFPALRELGLAAIGPAPAVMATAAYLALPLFRSLLGGLASADPDAVAAARAIGMTEARLTAEIRVPLAMPVFAGGLRVAVVQSIGLMTLGGLVGAGGLGALVFEGLAQFATDLMLLGALPIVALALAADTAIGAAEQRA